MTTLRPRHRSRLRRRARTLVAVIGALGLLSLLVSAQPAAAVGENVFISELHYDNAGGDVGEFVEVSGDAGSDLTGWSIVLYNGNGGGQYNSFALNGTISDEGAGQGAVVVATAGLQNGAPDGLALIDDGGNVVEFLSYEGSFTAADGPAAGVLSTDIGVTEGSGTSIGHSLQLLDGAWTGPAPESPGLLNTPPSGPQAVFIHEVQGAGSASPLVGQSVIIEGIVVGDFQEIVTGDPGDEPLDGFFVQEEDGDADGDPATSEGIFVFAPGGAPVAVGDQVQVTGSISEFFGLTEIAFPDDVIVVSSNNPLPTPATPVLPTAVGDPTVDWEAMEGMSVSFAQPLYVTGLFPQGRYGEVQLSAIGAQNHPNQVHPVGSAAAADQAQLNLDSRVILDDGEDETESFNGIDTWNPTPTPYLIGPDNTLRSGDTVSNLFGVVHYAWNEYEVQPVNLADPTDPDGGVDIARTESRPGVPDVGGSLTVASFNVLNYFTTIDTGGAQCGPPGFEQGCRGADTASEFADQAAKIVDALVDLDADIVGLIEIENNGDVAVADLVARLNADPDATRTYDFVETGHIGTDAITVALIFDEETVELDGDHAVLDASVSPAFIDDRNRPVLAQTFKDKGTEETVTIAVNHLKSKGSSCSSVVNPGDPAYGVDPYGAGVDGTDPNFQGNCNLTRTAAARVLGQWLASGPTGSPSHNLLVLGDLNAYANEDPITELEGQGYVDLVERDAGGNAWALGAHTYVFNGELGSLDYAMANPVLGQQVTGAAAWHINADEPFAIDYQNFNPPGQYTPDEFKSSDHDPVVIGLALQPSCDGHLATIVGSGTIRGTDGPDVIVGSDGDDRVIARAGDDVICGGDGHDVLLGQAGDDHLDGGDGHDVGNGGTGDADTCVNVEVARRCEN